MIARTGKPRRFPNAVRMVRAAVGSVEVSTMIDPPSPWITITLLPVTNGHVDAVRYPDHLLAELVRLRP
jgi:hypothetical protein